MGDCYCFLAVIHHTSQSVKFKVEYKSIDGTGTRLNEVLTRSQGSQLTCIFLLQSMITVAHLSGYHSLWQFVLKGDRCYQILWCCRTFSECWLKGTLSHFCVCKYSDWSLPSVTLWHLDTVYWSILSDLLHSIALGINGDLTWVPHLQDLGLYVLPLNFVY